MTEKEIFTNIKNAIESALDKYNTDNIDLVRNNSTGMIDLVYHSRHNSFSIVKNLCPADSVTESHVQEIADYYAIGWCW